MIAEIFLASAFLILGYLLGSWHCKKQLSKQFIFNRSVFIATIITDELLYNDHLDLLKRTREKIIEIEEINKEISSIINYDKCEDNKG